MSCATRGRFVSLLVLGLLGLTSMITGLNLVQPISASGGSQVTLSSSASTLVGGELWLNSSYPFQSEAASSTILALPALSVWLTSHDIAKDQLRPYLSLWSSQGNPYDYAQTTVGFADNNTVYGVYQYILPNGTVIGVWASEGSLKVVESIYTFASQNNSVSYGGSTANNDLAAGHQAQDSNSGGSYPMDGAEYNTTVFSDLASPSSCGSYCWDWGNWLGTSNYNWLSSSLPSDPFFFQVILAYWGGNQAEPSNCGSNSYASNCVFFQYALDGTTLLTTTPNVGDWTSGDAVTMEWVQPTANCSPAGGVSGGADWVVELKITNRATGQYTSSGECFPDNQYVQFLEERPGLSGGHLAQNPEFGTHNFWGAINNYGNKVALNSGSNTWKLNLYNTGLTTELVSSTTPSNGAHGSTWSDSWLSSSYP